jgi:hypothetical protein
LKILLRWVKLFVVVLLKSGKRSTPVVPGSSTPLFVPVMLTSTRSKEP